MKWMCLWIVSGAMACASSSKTTIDDAAPAADAPRVDAGVPDAPMAKLGHTGGGIVAGGVRSSSPNFRLIGTLNSGGASASPSFKARTGVVGATQ